MPSLAGSYPDVCRAIDAGEEIGLRLTAIRTLCQAARKGQLEASDVLIGIEKLVDRIEEFAAA